MHYGKRWMKMQRLFMIIFDASHNDWFVSLSFRLMDDRLWRLFWIKKQTWTHTHTRCNACCKSLVNRELIAVTRVDIVNGKMVVEQVQIKPTITTLYIETRKFVLSLKSQWVHLTKVDSVSNNQRNTIIPSNAI